MNCAYCEDKVCYQGKDCTEIRDETIKQYNMSEEDLEMAKVASSIEAKYYMKLTRIEEFIMFCKEMKYSHVGIAFCIGLSEEAKILQQILEQKGIKVSSVCCKVCGIPKSKFNLEKIDETKPEVMCSPLGQAKILNQAKVNLNIIFGLCIGHDILFSKHSDAPVTTLVVKDRVLAHNPIGAIYSGYYRRNKLI
ncbi:MAG: DUF1847 domain-containing protein [bacterium]|nr:DUF1847 domain-containing protein [bacterium]